MTIVIIGLNVVMRGLTPEPFLDLLRKLVMQLAILGQRTAREASPKDTMALANSITLQVQSLSVRVYSPLPYADAMESGRPPGRMPPPQALVGWMARHGMSGVSPFVLARAIARRGIKGRFFFQKAVQAVQRALPGMANDLLQRFVRVWPQ